MTISDIIALAKNGYKPSEIKELLELGNAQPAPDAEKPAEIPAEEQRQPEPEKAVESSEAAADTNTVDQIKSLQEKIAKLESDLMKAQKSNQTKDLSGTAPKVTTTQQVEEIVRSFM